MKKISTLLISGLVCVTGLTTSCSEDYPGPDPVDVTANYSNKFSNPNPNLSLTYSGDNMIGKSVDFSTVKGEAANITLYDIIPGEETLKLVSIPLFGDDTSYSFSGNGTGSVTGTTFNYDGRVEKGKLTINLTNIKIGNSSQWAKKYQVSQISYGRGKSIVYNDETDKYEWGEEDNVILTAPLYTSMDVELDTEEVGNNIFLYSNITGGVRGIGSYMIAQLLNSIQLEADGNIIAEYTTDDLYLGEQKFSEIDANDPESMGAVISFIVSKLLFAPTTQDDINKVTKDINRKYTSSSRGLAYWYMKNSLCYIKLNIPAIITQVMQDQGKFIDQNLLATLTDAILNSNPVQLQQILVKLNEQLDNSLIALLAGMDNTDFQLIFSWIKDGIPMHVGTDSGYTHIHVEKEILTPFVKFIPYLKPLLDEIPNASMLYSLYLEPLMQGWPQIKKLDLGIGLTEQ